MYSILIFGNWLAIRLLIYTCIYTCTCASISPEWKKKLTFSTFDLKAEKKIKETFFFQVFSVLFVSISITVWFG